MKMDLSEALDLQIARRKVQDFHDQLISDHQDAMACRDCEDHLTLGMLAFQWLNRADETLAEAAREKLIDYTPDIHSMLEDLYKLWLEPCPKVFAWIGKVLESGHRPENLDAFLQTHSRAKLRASALRVPSASDLDLIAYDFVPEWKREEPWIQ